MDLSFFLARTWGLGVTLICLGTIFNRKQFISMLTKMGSAESMLAGLFVLGIGVAQVVGYERWELTWMGLITLLGWSSLLKGALLFLVPGYSDKFVKFAVKEHIYTASMIIGLVLGLYLLYVGYFMH